MIRKERNNKELETSPITRNQLKSLKTSPSTNNQDQALIKKSVAVKTVPKFEPPKIINKVMPKSTLQNKVPLFTHPKVEKKEIVNKLVESTNPNNFFDENTDSNNFLN